MSEESPSDRILTGDDRERGSQADQEKAPDPNIVDWDGPDDPSNPLNWSISKKTTTISMVSFLTLLS